MTVTFTPNLGLTTPDFDHRNWHSDINNTIALLEEAIAGVTTKAITGSDFVSITDGVSSEGRFTLLEFTGTVTPPATITIDNVTKFYLFLNNTNQILSISNGSGATVTIAVGTYSLVYNDGTDVFKIFEILTSSPELGAVAHFLSDKSFREHFDTFDTSLWTNFQTLVGQTATVVADDAGNRKSVYGGNFLQLFKRAGYYFKPLPFNPDATYKVSGRLRQDSNGGGSHQVFVGLVGIAADGTTIVDTVGASSASPLAQHMAAESAFQLDSDVPGTWTYFEGFVKGTAASGDAGPNKDVGVPAKMHEDVRYIAPAFVVNWDSVDAVCDIDSIELEIIEERNVVNGVPGFDLQGKANAQGLGLALATLGLQANPQAMTADIVLLDDPTDVLGRALQIFTPDADWNLDLPAAVTQPLCFWIQNEGTGGFDILVRTSAAEEVVTLADGEWIFIVSSSLTPTVAAEWRVLAKSEQQRVLTGSGNFRVPQGVSSISVIQLVGGGGGGAGAQTGQGGGGGGGGAVRESQVLAVVPGAEVAYVVGDLGAGGIAGANGDAGVETSFGALIAESGKGGITTPTAGGLGGDPGGVHGNGGDGNRGGVTSNPGEAGLPGLYAPGGAGGGAPRGGGGGGGSIGAGGDGAAPGAAGADGLGTGAGGGGGGGFSGAGIGGDGVDGTIIIRF